MVGGAGAIGARQHDNLGGIIFPAGEILCLQSTKKGLSCELSADGPAQNVPRKGMEMARIDVIGTMKVNGVELHFGTARMHESWIARALEYGVKQLVNDTYSGEKGQVKHDLCRAMLADMMNGKPMPVKERKAPTARGIDAVRALAREKATSFLVAGLTKKFGKDMATWAAQPALQKLFRFTEKGTARFDLVAVDVWMEGAIKAQRDFMQEAREELESAEDIGLEDLGL